MYMYIYVYICICIYIYMLSSSLLYNHFFYKKKQHSFNSFFNSILNLQSLVYMDEESITR